MPGTLQRHRLLVMKINPRVRAVAMVFLWAALAVIAWVVGVFIAPDGGPDCVSQGFSCPDDLQWTLLILGLAFGGPVLVGAVIVGVLAVLVVYWRRPQAGFPVLIATAAFWIGALVTFGGWIAGGRLLF